MSRKYYCDSCKGEIANNDHCSLDITASGLDEDILEYDCDEFDLCIPCYKRVLAELKANNLTAH